MVWMCLNRILLPLGIGPAVTAILNEYPRVGLGLVYLWTDYRQNLINYLNHLLVALCDIPG